MFDLLKFLQTIKPMSPRLEAYLIRVIKPRFFKKGEIILNIGQIHDEILYIQKGLVRAFRYNYKGREVTNWFMKETDIFISVISFFERVPATEVLIAIEDCTCFGITYDKLDKICNDMPEFKDHRIIITQLYYSRAMRRETQFKNEHKDTKFKTLMEQTPDLIDRVTNPQLATYLGVSTRSLNDMKKNYFKKSAPKKSRKKSIQKP